MLEIDVDIRRLVALGRDEALEQQIDLAGIDGSDTEAVADRGVGGRAPALTQDFLPAGIAHDVMHRQEIGRVAELPDQVQLMPHGRRDPGRHMTAVAFRRADPGQPFELLLRGASFRYWINGIDIF